MPRAQRGGQGDETHRLFDPPNRGKPLKSIGPVPGAVAITEREVFPWGMTRADRRKQ